MPIDPAYAEPDEAAARQISVTDKSAARSRCLVVALAVSAVTAAGCGATAARVDGPSDTASAAAPGANLRHSPVVHQPTRPAVENVPFTVTAVEVNAAPVTGTDVVRGIRGGPLMVTGAAAERMVRDFNQLKVRPDGIVSSCSASALIKRATFRSDGHAWVASVGNCGGVRVTLNGQPLATLHPSVPFSSDLYQALRDPLGPNLALIPPAR
jgi:hypothetical protein